MKYLASIDKKFKTIYCRPFWIICAIFYKLTFIFPISVIYALLIKKRFRLNFITKLVLFTDFTCFFVLSKNDHHIIDMYFSFLSFHAFCHLCIINENDVTIGNDSFLGPNDADFRILRPILYEICDYQVTLICISDFCNLCIINEKDVTIG